MTERQIIEWVKQEWLPLLGFIVPVISTVYFYFKAKKTKVPTYLTKTFNLVQDKVNKFDKVEITYSGQKVDNLGITKVLFWNDGKETINSTDEAEGNPLRIAIEGEGEILDSKIIFEKSASNRFSINNRVDGTVGLGFDYLDQGDGFIVQVFHTASSDKNIVLLGKIKGVGKIKRKVLDNSKNSTIKKSKIGIWLYKNKRLIISIVIFAVPIIFIIAEYYGYKHPKSPTKGGLIASILMALFYWIYGIIILKRKVPKAFDKLEEGF